MQMHLLLLCFYNQALVTHTNATCPHYKLGTKPSTTFSTMDKYVLQCYHCT